MSGALRTAGQFVVILALFAGVAFLSDRPTWHQIPDKSGVVLLTFVQGPAAKASAAG
jgi:hypothetical protein